MNIKNQNHIHFNIFVVMSLQPLENRIKYTYFSLALIIFIIMAVRNALVPFNHDEIATFYMYIQTGEFWPYFSIVDANNHILNSSSTYVCYKLFGDSYFALRIPNLMAFIIMTFAIYRLLFYLKTKTAKIVLISVFLIAFNWISFYNICRGYGISMALLLLAFVFILEYFRRPKVWLFYGFLLVIQLAIAANLTLIILTLMLSILILFYQITNKLISDWRLIPGYFMHMVSLGLWVDFSFFLQEGNALYYGQGDSYWEVTFVTVIELITGWINIYIDYIIASIMILISGYSIYSLIKENVLEKIRKMNSLFIFTTLFVGVVVAFFVLHHWKGINYPEDRTGLFYYPLGMLMLVFMIDQIKSESIRKLFLVLPALVLVQFFILLNFKSHPMNEYETVPERFYTRLLEEQEKSKDKITISGRRLNELMFAFLNYRNGGTLNPVDDSEKLNLYSDYALTKTEDRERYKELYDVIDEDDWDFVLLKRKKKCKRELIQSINSEEWKDLTVEFTEYLRMGDTVFSDTRPLLFEFNFDIDHAAQPFYGWIVLEIKDKEGKLDCYRRFALNWIKYSWNHTKNNQLLIITGDLPKNATSIVAYLWNSRKQFVRIRMKKINIFRLIENEN